MAPWIGTKRSGSVFSELSALYVDVDTVPGSQCLLQGSCEHPGWEKCFSLPVLQHSALTAPSSKAL